MSDGFQLIDELMLFETEHGFLSNGITNMEALVALAPELSEQDIAGVLEQISFGVLAALNGRNLDIGQLVTEIMGNAMTRGITLGTMLERRRHEAKMPGAGPDDIAFLESIEPEEDPSES